MSSVHLFLTHFTPFPARNVAILWQARDWTSFWNSSGMGKYSGAGGPPIMVLRKHPLAVVEYLINPQITARYNTERWARQRMSIQPQNYPMGGSWLHSFTRGRSSSSIAKLASGNLCWKAYIILMQFVFWTEPTLPSQIPFMGER